MSRKKARNRPTRRNMYGTTTIPLMGTVAARAEVVRLLDSLQSDEKFRAASGWHAEQVAARRCLLRAGDWMRRNAPLEPAMKDMITAVHRWGVMEAVISELVGFLLIPEGADNIGQRKPWGDDEVERAVLWRAEGVSLEEIGLRLGRTSQAVATRITQAVGIERIQQRIRGLLDGDLDGDQVAGMFDGTITKVKR